MIRTVRLLVVVAILVVEFGSVQGQAQARDTVAMMRTRNNTAKTQANALGDLKAKFDKLDQDVTRAAQLGRTDERRIRLWWLERPCGLPRVGQRSCRCSGSVG